MVPRRDACAPNASAAPVYRLSIRSRAYSSQSCCVVLSGLAIRARELHSLASPILQTSFASQCCSRRSPNHLRQPHAPLLQSRAVESSSGPIAPVLCTHFPRWRQPGGCAGSVRASRSGIGASGMEPGRRSDRPVAVCIAPVAQGRLRPGDALSPRRHSKPVFSRCFLSLSIPKTCPLVCCTRGFSHGSSSVSQ